jgi:hypothetical protein
MSNYGANMPPSATAGAYSGNGMPPYGANMPPSLTAGAYSGNGMPPYGMQAPAEYYPNASIKGAPFYTSPASYGPYPTGYSPMHYGHMKPAPVYAGAATCSVGVILVLYILLVIILRTI